MACRPEPAISLTIGLTRAVVTHANGDSAAGLEILRVAQQELQRLNGPYVMAASLREWEARLLAATGQVEQARALVSTSTEPRPASVATHAVRAELQLAEGDPAGAVATLRPCLDGSVRSLVAYQRLETLLLDAMARRRLGDLDGAATSVEHALQVAEPEGYRQVFGTSGRRSTPCCCGSGSGAPPPPVARRVVQPDRRRRPFGRATPGGAGRVAHRPGTGGARLPR